VVVANQIQSFFVINPLNGSIAQLEVFDQSELSWKTLFSAIRSLQTEVKINNIDDRLIAKIKAVESAGLKHTVNQYEMELVLNKRP
jgi:hypothetical protein